jgi:peroxiredoxin
MAIVRGIEGYLKIQKVAPASGYDNVKFVSQWQASLQTQQVDAGPFLNDNGKMYTFTTTKRVNGSFQVTLPTDQQSTHTRLINISNDGEYIGLQLVSKGGYTMIVPSAIITGYQLTNAANDQVTISFDFMDNGGFTVAPAVLGDYNGS